jgi:hypothetical protein
MLGEIASALKILDVLTGWFKKLPFSKKEQQDTIVTRFFQLFEAHGVHRNQIPSLINHGLTIANIQTEESLLPCHNEELLNDVCELFAVRREWLDGFCWGVYRKYEHGDEEWYQCYAENIAFETEYLEN